jgi:hypothetical protein
MSMKRTKPRSSGSNRSSGKDDDPPAWGKSEGPEPSWADVESKPESSFVPFVMSSRYAKGDLILHSKFGRGLVLGVEGTRIEVLFQDGKKKLGRVVT